MKTNNVNLVLAVCFATVVVIAIVILAKDFWQHQVDVMMTPETTEHDVSFSETLRGIQLVMFENMEPGPDVDVALLEVPDYLIKQDAEGPYFEIVTEKGRYMARLEKVGNPFAGQIHITTDDEVKPECLWVWSEVQEDWLETEGCPVEEETK